MAVFTTRTMPFKPLVYKNFKTLFSSSYFFGFQLRHNLPTTTKVSISLSSRPTPISARFGGGGGGSFRKRPPEIDPALDFSSIKSDEVRLIDQDQNNVGIVKKSVALQMAEDAELDLVILAPDAEPPVVRIMDYSQLVVSESEILFAIARGIGNLDDITGYTSYMHRHQRKVNRPIPQRTGACLPTEDLSSSQVIDSFLNRSSKYRYEQQKKKKVQQKKAGRMDLKELKMGSNIDVHDYSVRLRAAQKFLKDGDKVKVIVSMKGREKEFRNNAIELLTRFQNDLGELASEESKNFKDRNLYIILLPNKAVVQKGQDEPKKKEKSMPTEASARV